MGKEKEWKDTLTSFLIENWLIYKFEISLRLRGQFKGSHHLSLSFILSLCFETHNYCKSSCEIVFMLQLWCVEIFVATSFAVRTVRFEVMQTVKTANRVVIIVHFHTKDSHSFFLGLQFANKSESNVRFRTKNSIFALQIAFFARTVTGYVSPLSERKFNSKSNDFSNIVAIHFAIACLFSFSLL